MRGLVVTTDGSGAVREIEPNVEALQGVFDGAYFTGTNGDGWVAYYPEAGEELAPNPLAAAVLRWLNGGAASPPVAGTCVFFGTNAVGDETDVPAQIINLHHRLLHPNDTQARAPMVPIADDAVTVVEAVGPDGRRLRRIATEILRAMAADGEPVDRNAILAARIGKSVYQHFGHTVTPVPVAPVLLSQLALQTGGKDGHTVGTLGAGVIERDGRQVWDGHLVLAVDQWIIDLTAGQFSRPEQGITVGGPVILDAGEALPAAPGAQFGYMRADGGATIYRVTEDMSWRQSAPWTQSSGRVGRIEAAVTARAAQYDVVVPEGLDPGNIRCQVCRRGLNRIDLADGTVVFQHGRSWETYDHEAVPEFGVAPDAANAACDFCSELGVRWVYTGPIVEAEKHISPITGQPQPLRRHSRNWNGCSICDRHILNQDLDGLFKAYMGTHRHRQTFARLPASASREAYRQLTRQWRQYVPHITRRIPLNPEPVGPLSPRSVPKVCARAAGLIRNWRWKAFGSPSENVIAPGPDLGVPDALVVVADHVPEAAQQRFTERIAAGLDKAIEDRALYYVSKDFALIALDAGKELPDISLHREELPEPHGLIVWEEPIMAIPTPDSPTANEALIMGASWTTVSDLGVWVVLYVRTEQFLAGDPAAKEAVGVLLPHSSGGGLEFDTDYRDALAEPSSEAPEIAERIYRTLLSTWYLIQQPGVADVQRQPTIDKKAIKAARRAGTTAPEVRVVTLRRHTSRKAGGGGVLTVRFRVRSHWKRVWYGPGKSQRRTQRIQSFMKGPQDAPVKVSADVPVVKHLR